MALQKLLSYTEQLEDPNHPLMGPNLRGLYFFGLQLSGSKLRRISYTILHISTYIFVVTLFVDLYEIRHDLNLVFNNLSMNVLSLMCITKCASLIYHQKEWFDLIDNISEKERKQIEQNDQTTLKFMKEYTIYTRVVTYLFWAMVFVTNLFFIVSPFVKCFSKSYREDLMSGKEPLPQILFSWFPFDNKKMPGYFWGLVVHVFMGFQGAGVISVFDANAIAIMSYLKGQMIIINEKSREIFHGKDLDMVVHKIRELHEHHNELIKQHKRFNSLLSPPMFLYVLVSSITICGSAVQFTSKGATTSQKLWVLEYTVALVFQLFLYCWHANEVTYESTKLSRGVYDSDWWMADTKLRRLVLLLAGKFEKTLVLEGGPLASLSVPTFIEIIRGSYSFFTLFSQMQYE